MADRIARDISPNVDKAVLRAALLAARSARAGEPSSAAADAQLGARLRALLDAYAPRCVGFYWPTADEFDPRPSVVGWLADDPTRRAALPVVAQPHAPLVFHAWLPGMAMARGRYGIAVPAQPKLVTPDLLLIPCVGFDAMRLRLGYGGGYYDRTLAAQADAGARPATIGVAYECSRVDALPREPHDLPLDVIVTESAQY